MRGTISQQALKRVLIDVSVTVFSYGQVETEMKKMFERHRGKDSIDVIFITIQYFHPSVNAIQPVCMDIVASSRVECLCCCSEYVPQGKKVLLRSRSEPGIYADLRGDRTLDLFGVNEM